MQRLLIGIIILHGRGYYNRLLVECSEMPRKQAAGWAKAVPVAACAAGVSALFYGRRKKREAARQCAVPEREETQKEK